MRTPHAKHARGFVLIEALIALLIVSIGLLAISKLEGLTISAAGESRSRSEAVTLSQRKLEQLRNWVLESGANSFNSGLVTGGPVSVAGINATYTFEWTVPAVNPLLPKQRSIELTTSWTDRFGSNQKLDLNSLITWDDPYNQLQGQKGFSGVNGPSPTGAAIRGKGSEALVNGTPPGVANNNGTGTYTYTKSDNTVELLNSAGKIILYLPPTASGQAQAFTTISGRVYFDQTVNPLSKLPPSADVDVRLSSEGQCFYDHTAANLVAVTAGTNSYKYFSYVCYVGPGWYGNVGVVNNVMTGNGASPNVCVGDPTFTSTSSIQTSPAVDFATNRSYRGFYDPTNAWTSGVCPQCLPVGVPGSRAYPTDGSPVPSAFPTYYPGVTAGSSADHFNQHFLITDVGNGSCASKMTGGEFSQNAGAYVCITPDNKTTHADICPTTWPGFTTGTSNQNTITETLTINGSGGGLVTSNPAGISCDTSTPCTTTSGSFATGTTVVLTATPAQGSVFGGWGGACTGIGTCSVTLTTATAVTATFNPGTTTYNLGVTLLGTSGTVTSDIGLINCPTTCTDTYNSNAVVTLTAAPGPNQFFTGWGGDCSSSGASPTCQVTMGAVKNVTATFAASVTPYDLTVSKSSAAAGSITSSPSLISCGTTCTSTTASIASGTVVTLTATPASGYGFTGWSSGSGSASNCSGTGTCTVTMSAAGSVTANFDTYCSAKVTGSAHDSSGVVTVVTSGVTGSCAMQGGGSKNYTCASLNAINGTTVVLQNSSTTNNYSYNLSLSTWNCANKKNADFP